MHICPKIDN